MDRYSFNKLSIEEQVEYFNNELSQDTNSIKSVCNSLQISYNTIRERFLRNDYNYNKYAKKYENVSKVFQYDDEMLEKAIERVVERVFSSASVNHKVDNLNSLKSERMGNITSRSFRIYDNVLDRFIDFCQKSELSQYEVLSKFIDDGINKYA